MIIALQYCWNTSNSCCRNGVGQQATSHLLQNFYHYQFYTHTLFINTFILYLIDFNILTLIKILFQCTFLNINTLKLTHELKSPIYLHT